MTFTMKMYRSYLRLTAWLPRALTVFGVGGFVLTATICIVVFAQSFTFLRETRDDGLSNVLTMEMEPIQVPCPPCPSAETLCTTVEKDCPPVETPTPLPPPAQGTLNRINCSINQEYIVGCRQDDSDIYMPVSFINKYFEVYGEKIANDTGEFYSFRHSYAPIIPVQKPYSPFGIFLNFFSFDVEARPTVLCDTAAESVPIAIQWDPRGYFYPISVAQFGLSHHAKMLLMGRPNHTTLVRADMDMKKWIISDSSRMSVKSVEADVDGVKKKVVAFNSSQGLNDPGPTLVIDRYKFESLFVKIRMVTAGGLSITTLNRDGKYKHIHYTHSDKYIEKIKEDTVVYGMKSKNAGKWIKLVRNLGMDWQKAVGGKEQLQQKFTKLMNITLHGTGFIEYITTASDAHMELLVSAADWFVQNQDNKGGWLTTIPLVNGRIQLAANWYSAMGQGQAMSCLVRAYNVTGNTKYLDTAVRALNLFTVSSAEGGVKARFFNQLDWYEEYPTTPSSFVLNGFIFSLLGLYDVTKTVKGDGKVLAEQLWTSGVKSLKALLGAFDTGSGTLYDLRHVILHEPPNRARWDYHTTHLALIQQMAVIEGDKVFYEAAERWTAYLTGNTTKHN